MANAYMTGMGKGILRALEPKAIKETMDLFAEMKASELMREESALMAKVEQENLLEAKRLAEEQWEKDNAETKAFIDGIRTPPSTEPGALGKPIETEKPSVTPEATATNPNTASAMKGAPAVNTNVDIKPDMPTTPVPPGAMSGGKGPIPPENTATVAVEDTVTDKLPRLSDLPDVKGAKPYAAKPIAVNAKDYYEQNFSYLTQYQKQGQLMQRVAWRLGELGYTDQANKFASDAASYDKKHTEEIWTKVTNMSMASDTDGMKNMLRRMGWKNLESVSFSANEDGDGQDINFRMANGVVTKMDKSTFESMSPSVQSQIINRLAITRNAAEAKLLVARINAEKAERVAKNALLKGKVSNSIYGAGPEPVMDFVNVLGQQKAAEIAILNRNEPGVTKAELMKYFMGAKKEFMRDVMNSAAAKQAIAKGDFTEDDLKKYLNQPVNEVIINRLSTSNLNLASN